MFDWMGGQMNVKYLKKVGFGHKFLLQDTRYDIVNGIRRGIIGHVKTMAIENVIIYKNESVMPDEFLAHRLGLIPIKVDDFDSNTEFSLYLKKTSGVVKSGDIDDNGMAEIPLKNIPVVDLNEGKSLECELIVKASDGRDHIKWSPALVYYNNVPSLKQHKSVDKAVMDACPKHSLELKANKAVLTESYNCDACRFCEVASNGALELVLEENNFVLTIEPYGNLSLEKIITGLDDAITSELDDLAKNIKELK